MQDRIAASGRRTGLAGTSVEHADRAVFNPDWGIDPARVLSPITIPANDVLREALNLYQTAFRRPSFTVYCLDVSGSMNAKTENRSTRIEELKSAMRLLIEPDQAQKYFLQTSGKDVTIVIPFHSQAAAEWRVDGSNPEQLRALLGNINQLSAGGGTNIYDPAIRGLQLVDAQRGRDDYATAVILMTDGESGETGKVAALIALSRKLDVPVFSIKFGEASGDQLDALASATSGKVFDGAKDLDAAFRQAAATTEQGGAHMPQTKTLTPLGVEAISGGAGLILFGVLWWFTPVTPLILAPVAVGTYFATKYFLSEDGPPASAPLAATPASVESVLCIGRGLCERIDAAGSRIGRTDAGATCHALLAKIAEHAEGIVRSAAKVFDQSRTQDDYLALAIIITDDSLAPAEELLRQASGFAQQEEDLAVVDRGLAQIEARLESIRTSLRRLREAYLHDEVLEIELGADVSRTGAAMQAARASMQAGRR